MNRNFYIPFFTLISITMCGCNNGEQLKSGLMLENLDKSISLGNDFYSYACGGWMKAHPLTAEYARYGNFDMLDENNQKRLKDIITETSDKNETARVEGSNEQKIGDLYSMAMDSVTLNENGCEPIKNDLESIAKVDSYSALVKTISILHHSGVNSYFGMYVGPDDMCSDINIVQLCQGGYMMGDRDYYLENDKNTLKIRDEYKSLIKDMFILVGRDESEAIKAMNDVMKIETALASAASAKEALRNPIANYHKTTLAELKSGFSSMDWSLYFDELGLQSVDSLNIGQPVALQAAVNIIKNEDLEAQKNYLSWAVINGAASFLSDVFVQRKFDFYGRTLSGKKIMQPRWKRAVNTVDGVLGEVVGQIYTERYFPQAAKERMVTLVGNLQKSFKNRIQNLSWMSDDTKAKAIEKLDAFHVKVGFPDKWRDYSKLEIKKDSYWDNIKRSNIFETDYMLADAGKKVDKDRWQMTPQTVNAYYNPTTNEICFPAGILQYPFFDMEADDAFNYGAIGVVIGHEMTHGFDDQGRLYDKDGNVNDWWTKEDGDNFNKRAKVMSDFYDKIEVLPGLMANGEYTLGENLADHGGLQISYSAFSDIMKNKNIEDKDGFTPQQRFFLSYATVWAQNVRDEQIRFLTKMDVHSLGRWRVNGALPHIDSWYDAFNITENDKLYVAPEERVRIW